MADEISIHSDFPGGNIVVESIDGDDIELRPDLRDTNGNWFYWYFAVSGAAGRKLTFHFGEYPVLAANGPAVSDDGGETWRWLGSHSVNGNNFTYDFPSDAGERHFCLAFPYVESNLNSFLARRAANPRLKEETLCVSEQGRDVELLRIGCFSSEPSFKAILTCRHHACEMMANYVLEGIIRNILDAESGSARELRENCEFLIVPFVDKDGVENGDQGKNRRPRDHNRDYDNTPIHNSVKAIKRLIPEWTGGKLALALDIHCPHLKGKGNEDVYLVGSESESVWRGQQDFSKILERIAATKRSLPFSSDNNIPFGVGWNSSANFAGGKTFIKWIGETFPDIKLATSIEIPYSNAGGTPVTPDSARAFGANLAESIAEIIIAQRSAS